MAQASSTAFSAEQSRRLRELARESLRVDAGSRWSGHLLDVTASTILTSLKDVFVGESCTLFRPGQSKRILAEVVALRPEGAVLTPFEEISGVAADWRARGTGSRMKIGVGEGLVGRAVDPLGNPVDGGGPLQHLLTPMPVYAPAPTPLSRGSISRPLPLGVRVIDAGLTCGEGARFGIFAGAGVGKSTLLGQICRHCAAQRVVIALVGERGREVPEFFREILPPAVRHRAVAVVSTSDRSAVEKALAAETAMSIAEYFRDRGESVLLMVDSLTRYVRAAREVALAAGETAGRGGFPPSVFGRLARLLERAGPAPKGTITGLFTVLIEGDDIRSDPVADEAMSLIDGHIVLSRDLAAAGRYPAVDLCQSISRVMPRIASAEHLEAAGRARSWLKKAMELELLVQIGEYAAGNDAVADLALKKAPLVAEFFKQAVEAKADYSETISSLMALTDVGSSSSPVNKGAGSASRKNRTPTKR